MNIPGLRKRMSNINESVQVTRIHSEQLQHLEIEYGVHLRCQHEHNDL